MQTIADEVDGAFYVDIVLSPAELKRLKTGEMLPAEMILRHRKYYIGVRLQGLWDYDAEEEETKKEVDLFGEDHD